MLGMKPLVLILVLLDDENGECTPLTSGISDTVLILVLLDDENGGILEFIKENEKLGLNPCFTG